MDKRLIAYAESHDEERLMYKNLNFGNSSNSNHDVKDLDTALTKNESFGFFFIINTWPKNDMALFRNGHGKLNFYMRGRIIWR